MIRNGKTTPVPNAFTTPPAWTSQTRGDSPAAMRSSSLTCPTLAGRQLSGYGSSAESPPVTVSHWPLPHSGQGGRCFVDPTSIWLPQLVHLYVPAETSLPAGTGFAMARPCPVGNGENMGLRDLLREDHVAVGVTAGRVAGRQHEPAVIDDPRLPRA